MQGAASALECLRPPPSSGTPPNARACQISAVRAAALSLSSPPHTENRHSGKDPWFSAKCLFAQSFLSQNTHAGVAALSSHGGHDLPAVNDGVVALNAAQQGVPVVAEGEGPAVIEKGAPPPAPPTGLAPSPAPPPPRACLNRLRPAPSPQGPAHSLSQ